MDDFVLSVYLNPNELCFFLVWLEQVTSVRLIITGCQPYPKLKHRTCRSRHGNTFLPAAPPHKSRSPPLSPIAGTAAKNRCRQRFARRCCWPPPVPSSRAARTLRLATGSCTTQGYVFSTFCQTGVSPCRRGIPLGLYRDCPFFQKRSKSTVGNFIGRQFIWHFALYCRAGPFGDSRCISS